MSSPIRGRKRRKRKPVVKVDLFAKAKWLVAKGMPSSYVAARLGISLPTERRWRRDLMNHDHVAQELRRRVLQLPEHLRDKIAAAIHEKRRAA